MSELAMIGWLWIGFWIGTRHGRSKTPPIIAQLTAAALKIRDRHKFLGEGDFVPTYTATMTVAGEDYRISMMRDRSDRTFIVQRTLQPTTHQQGE